MSKIVRKDQRIFAGDVPAVNVVSQFGSLKAGSPQYSSDPDTIQSLSAWGAGWGAAAVNNAAPALQDMNAIFHVLTRNVRYAQQIGMHEYSATMDYQTGSVVYDPSTATIYMSNTDDNTGNELTNATCWRNIFSKNVQSSASNYVVANSDYMVRLTGTSALTVTVPQAVTANIGRELVIKSAVSGALVSVSATGGSLIDGLATQLLSQYQTLRIVSNGASWDIV